MVDSFNVAAAAPSEVRLSPDGSKLYSAGSDGVLRVYSVKTGALIDSWQVGVKLGGLDISPDGSFLMVVERQPVSGTPQSGNMVVTVYKVDTATGQSTSYPMATTGYETLFFDLAILSDGKVLLGQDFFGSGGVKLKVLDPATGQYAIGPNGNQSAVFTRSATGATVLIGEPNSSDGPLEIYQTGSGIVANTASGGYNWGIQAFNGTLAANYIYNVGINVFNSALQLQTTLAMTPDWDWRGGRVADLLFDASGQNLYVLDNAANTIVQLRTSDWTVVQSIPVNAAVGTWHGMVGASFGNRLILDPQGRYFSVATDTGLVLVANPDAPAMTGTAGDDVMEGTLFDDVANGNGGADTIDGGDGDDVLNGGGGDDLLIGGSGIDSMTGGEGNDIYVVDNAADQILENAGEGTDEIRTALASYSLVGLANVENLTATSNASHDFRGSSGNNVITGGAAADILRLYDGGNDTVNAGAGNDNIFFIGSLDSSDVVNGGDGTDTLVLQGNYAGGLTLSANVTLIENISILGGGNTNFGDPGTNLYDYVLTTNDANFAAGIQARINGAALLPGEDFTFNGSAETNASFVVYGGKGVDTLTGGYGNDIFIYAEDRFAPGDTVNGGPGGYDGIFFRGNYTIDFNAPGYFGLMTGIENMTLMSITDERYSRGGDPAGFDYNITLADNQLLAGVELTVSGVFLMAGEIMILDGSQELDGTFRLFGGKGGDTLKGGAQNDLLLGNLGADQLTGGGGADMFRFDGPGDSNSANMDQILDFTPGTDKIDLIRTDANTLVDENQIFTWIGSNAFSGSAGQLRAYEQGGTWYVEGDVNGDAVADLVIALTLQGPTPLSQSDFLL